MSADQRSRIFSAIGIAAFALAAWQDGSVWTSGFCAGAAFAWLSGIALEYLNRTESASVNNKTEA